MSKKRGRLALVIHKRVVLNLGGSHHIRQGESVLNIGGDAHLGEHVQVLARTHFFLGHALELSVVKLHSHSIVDV